MAIRQIDTKEFDEMIAGAKPVVCDFFAEWCGPCKMLAPVMQKVADENAEQAEFVKVDIDKNPELAIRYGIMSIPYVAVFKGGEMTAKTLGYMSKTEFDAFVKDNA